MSAPKNFVGLSCVLLVLASANAYAQPDTAHARQVFAETNKRLTQLDSLNFVAKRPDAAYKAEGRAWFDGSAIAKIAVIERDDSGDVVSEFYYSAGALVFVYEAVKGFADSGNSNKQVTKLEERYYFRDGKLVKWISGMGKDQGENPSSSQDFTEVGKSRLAASNAFSSAARQARVSKAPAK
jgi:hypothetical protein